MAALEPKLQEKYEQLKTNLKEMEDLIIGMSGGVDSVLLSKVAYDVLGDKALAVTADSSSLPRRELNEIVALVKQIGVTHLVIKTDEMDNPKYTSNPVDRCYYCKSAMFAQFVAISKDKGFHWIAYGENIDDNDDHRPGAMAAKDYDVRAPLKDAHMTKADIRALAQYLNLPVWDKPAFACLASRFPYGSEITQERLNQVEVGEDVLWDLGFRQFRVRHHGEVARIEIEQSKMATLLEKSETIVKAFKNVGFRYVTLDLLGYRRGSMNESIV